ncbi:hypothetical protein CBLAS_1310 [Campylobacter blaseri]|nr:hypothetical protein CBLAS_1310 [Campylobacter blaseri]
MGRIFDGFVGIILDISLFWLYFSRHTRINYDYSCIFCWSSFLKGIAKFLLDIFGK